jgi:cytochrome c oxidase cbb3-type subunit III
MTPLPPATEPEDPVRHHSYDGIQEYDKRLPNWWLYTLYIMIVFWVGYWGYYEWFRVGLDGTRALEGELARIEAGKLASATQVDDASLWLMSRNPAFVEAGKATYNANCAACHLASLRGKGENPTAIGPDLTDTQWIHGGRPLEVYAVIDKGVMTKGMPGWGPVLGSRKITETVAYILSKHREGEPAQVEGAAPDQSTTD